MQSVISLLSGDPRFPDRAFQQGFFLLQRRQSLLRRDVLHGMEAQDGHIGVEADFVPVPVATQRVAGILDQDQPVLGCQPSEWIHGERIPAEADGRDGPDPALLRLLNFPQLRLRLDGVETEGAQ